MKGWHHTLPKVELHRHLEGSLRLSTIAETIQHHNLDLPHKDLNALKKKVCAPTPLNDLAALIDLFANLQSIFVAPEVLERATFEAIEDAHKENVHLLELRYCPSYITGSASQLTYEDVFDSIQKGLKKAREKYHTEVGLIVTVNRGKGMDEGEKTLQHIQKHREYLIGIDLADNEKDADFHEFAFIFEKAKEAGIPITIHAGEIPGSAHNVPIAIEKLGAQRIGHGLQIIHEPEIVQKVIDRGIPLELCPTSNYLTQSVDTIKNHPIKKLFSQGVPVTINSDDPGMMGIDLTNEFRVCTEILGLEKNDLKTIIKQGLKSSFLDGDKKNYLSKKYFDL